MGKTKFTLDEHENIKRLVDSAIDASNKKEARKYIDKLDFFGYDVIGNTKYIFDSLVSYVYNVSGMVSDKDHKIGFVTQELLKLKSYGIEKDN